MAWKEGLSWRAVKGLGGQHSGGLDNSDHTTFELSLGRMRVEPLSAPSLLVFSIPCYATETPFQNPSAKILSSIQTNAGQMARPTQLDMSFTTASISNRGS